MAGTYIDNLQKEKIKLRQYQDTNKLLAWNILMLAGIHCIKYLVEGFGVSLSYEFQKDIVFPLGQGETMYYTTVY